MPTVSPSHSPTGMPTVSPSHAPTGMPTVSPSHAPTGMPTVRPSSAPTSPKPTGQFCFDSRAQLKTAVNEYITCEDDISCKMNLGYGYPIGSWCTEKVTDMSWMFYGSFNEPLTNWDTCKQYRAQAFPHSAALTFLSNSQR